MKKCNRCSNVVNENDKFCSKCGSNDFILEQKENKEEPIEFIYFKDGINPDGVGREVRYLNKSELSNNEPQKNKKNNKIVGYVIAGLLLLMAGGMALNILNDKGNNNNEEYEYEEENIEFTKGSIIDGIYQNEWADISFDMRDGWINGSSEDYLPEEDLITHGLSIKKGNSTLKISFIDVSSDTVYYSESEYLEEYLSGITGTLQNSSVIGPTYQMFGNRSYVYADVIGTVNGYNICITAGMRRIDDYIILVNVTGETKESNHEIFDKID